MNTTVGTNNSVQTEQTCLKYFDVFIGFISFSSFYGLPDNDLGERQVALGYLLISFYNNLMIASLDLKI